MAANLELVPATAGKRLGAAVLDWLAPVAVLVVTFAIGFAGITRTQSGGFIIYDTGSLVLFGGIGLGLTLVYLVVLAGMEGRSGATIGNRLMGIRSADKDGYAPGAGRSVPAWPGHRGRDPPGARGGGADGHLQMVRHRAVHPRAVGSARRRLGCPGGGVQYVGHQRRAPRLARCSGQNPGLRRQGGPQSHHHGRDPGPVQFRAPGPAARAAGGFAGGRRPRQARHARTPSSRMLHPRTRAARPAQPAVQCPAACAAAHAAADPRSPPPLSLTPRHRLCAAVVLPAGSQFVPPAGNPGDNPSGSCLRRSAPRR